MVTAQTLPASQDPAETDSTGAVQRRRVLRPHDGRSADRGDPSVIGIPMYFCSPAAGAITSWYLRHLLDSGSRVAQLRGG